MSVGVDIHTNTANRCCVYQLGSINQKMKKQLEVPIQFLCVFVCDDGDMLNILKVYISVTYHKWYLWTHNTQGEIIIIDKICITYISI